VLAGDDVTPWNLLHDGTIVRLERDLADTVTVWIDVPYVRARFGDGGTLFRFRLLRCTELVYTPLDEPPITDLLAIGSSEPGILQARVEAGDVIVQGSAGTLRLRYDTLALELDTGTTVPIDELRRVVGSYWDEWQVSRTLPPAVADALRRVT
jgi:hypothetical protein